MELNNSIALLNFLCIILSNNIHISYVHYEVFDTLTPLGPSYSSVASSSSSNIAGIITIHV